MRKWVRITCPNSSHLSWLFCPGIANLSLGKNWLFFPASCVISGSRNMCSCKNRQCQAIYISFSWSRSSATSTLFFIDLCPSPAVSDPFSYRGLFSLSVRLAPQGQNSFFFPALPCLPEHCEHRRCFTDTDWVSDVLSRNHTWTFLCQAIPPSPGPLLFFFRSLQFPLSTSHCLFCPWTFFHTRWTKEPQCTNSPLPFCPCYRLNVSPQNSYIEN